MPCRVVRLRGARVGPPGGSWGANPDKMGRYRQKGFLKIHASTCFTDVDRDELCAAAEARGEKAVSAGADAGAAVPVQPGLRGMREDSVPGTYFEEGPHARGVLPGSGGVWRADGVDPGRRAP